MPHSLTRTFRVRHYECDACGHLNNAHYPGHMQEAACGAAATVGYGFDWYSRNSNVWLVRHLRNTGYGRSAPLSKCAR